jgi:hypothetical protein
VVQIISCASPNSFLNLEIGDEALSKSAKKRQKAPTVASIPRARSSASEWGRQYFFFFPETTTRDGNRDARQW